MTEQKKNTTPNFKNRTIILDGEISEASARKVCEQIIAINYFDAECEYNNKDYVRNPINLIVNSFGGTVYDGNLIIGVIRTSDTPVDTYCFGKAMSAGLAIFISGRNRFAGELATFMYHDASVGIINSIDGLINPVNHFTKLRNMCDQFILENTKMPKHIMDKKKEIKEDWYFFAEEAVAWGVADEIINFTTNALQD